MLKIIDLLPRYFKEQDTYKDSSGKGLFEKYLEIFQEYFGTLESSIKDLEELKHITSNEDIYLADPDRKNLLEFFGDWPFEDLIKAPGFYPYIVNLYKIRGTKRFYEVLAKIYGLTLSWGNLVIWYPNFKDPTLKSIGQKYPWPTFLDDTQLDSGDTFDKEYKGATHLIQPLTIKDSEIDSKDYDTTYIDPDLYYKYQTLFKLFGRFAPLNIALNINTEKTQFTFGLKWVLSYKVNGKEVSVNLDQDSQIINLPTLGINHTEEIPIYLRLEVYGEDWQTPLDEAIIRLFEKNFGPFEYFITRKDPDKDTPNNTFKVITIMDSTWGGLTPIDPGIKPIVNKSPSGSSTSVQTFQTLNGTINNLIGEKPIRKNTLLKITKEGTYTLVARHPYLTYLNRYEGQMANYVEFTLKRSKVYKSYSLTYNPNQSLEITPKDYYLSVNLLSYVRLGDKQYPAAIRCLTTGEVLKGGDTYWNAYKPGTYTFCIVDAPIHQLTLTITRQEDNITIKCNPTSAIYENGGVPIQLSVKSDYPEVPSILISEDKDWVILNAIDNGLVPGKQYINSYSGTTIITRWFDKLNWIHGYKGLLDANYDNKYRLDKDSNFMYVLLTYADYQKLAKATFHLITQPIPIYEVSSPEVLYYDGDTFMANNPGNYTFLPSSGKLASGSTNTCSIKSSNDTITYNLYINPAALEFGKDSDTSKSFSILIITNLSYDKGLELWTNNKSEYNLSGKIQSTLNGKTQTCLTFNNSSNWQVVGTYSKFAIQLTGLTIKKSDCLGISSGLNSETLQVSLDQYPDSYIKVPISKYVEPNTPVLYLVPSNPQSKGWGTTSLNEEGQTQLAIWNLKYGKDPYFHFELAVELWDNLTIEVYVLRSGEEIHLKDISYTLNQEIKEYTQEGTYIFKLKDYDSQVRLIIQRVITYNISCDPPYAVLDSNTGGFVYTTVTSGSDGGLDPNDPNLYVKEVNSTVWHPSGYKFQASVKGFYTFQVKGDPTKTTTFTVVDPKDSVLEVNTSSITLNENNSYLSNNIIVTASKIWRATIDNGES